MGRREPSKVIGQGSDRTGEALYGDDTAARAWDWRLGTVSLEVRAGEGAGEEMDWGQLRRQRRGLRGGSGAKGQSERPGAGSWGRGTLGSRALCLVPARVTYLAEPLAIPVLRACGQHRHRALHSEGLFLFEALPSPS